MTLPFNAYQNNLVSVLSALVKKLNVNVSNPTLRKSLYEHPDFPSMLAVSDCLTSFKVPNQALLIDKTNCVLEELPLPFIAHLNIHDGQFALIHEIKGDKIKFSNEKNRRGVFTNLEFLELWDGVMLYAEKDAESGESNYWDAMIKGWFNNLRVPFLLAVLLLTSIYVIDFENFSWSELTILGLNSLGVILSTLLLIHSIDTNNPFIQNLCSLSKKNDCNAILKSDAAKVTSWLSWSEVGLFYFSGSFIYVLLNPTNLSLLSYINILCLPFTFYSIGYQIKTKKWCVLCCAVQLILWVTACIYLMNNYAFKNIDIAYSVSSILCFLFPIAIWSFIKPFLLKASYVKSLDQQLKKFKYNSALFNKLLESQQKYIIPSQLKPIVLGNPNAETIITIVSNPFCDPCSIAHKTLDSWIRERDDLKVNLLFATANHDDDRRTKFARHMIALSLSGDNELVERALNNWYNLVGKDHETWAHRFPIVLNNEVNDVLESHKKWCEITEISFTPTILVNGYKLVEPYRLDDIKYLLN